MKMRGRSMEMGESRPHGDMEPSRPAGRDFGETRIPRPCGPGAVRRGAPPLGGASTVERSAQVPRRQTTPRESGFRLQQLPEGRRPGARRTPGGAPSHLPASERVAAWPGRNGRLPARPSCRGKAGWPLPRPNVPDGKNADRRRAIDRARRRRVHRRPRKPRPAPGSRTAPGSADGRVRKSGSSQGTQSSSRSTSQ